MRGTAAFQDRRDIFAALSLAGGAALTGGALARHALGFVSVSLGDCLCPL